MDVPGTLIGSTGDQFGRSLAFSTDGNIVAVGAMIGGYVDIYQLKPRFDIFCIEKRCVDRFW